jgi:very-short-patch-repair endonuclease
MRRVQAEQVRSREPTKPERTLYAILDELGVCFDRQLTIGFYTVDATIPERRLVIEADGDYWHGRTGATEPRVLNRMRLDRSRDSYFRNRGWLVLRLWESDLADDPEGCRKRISQAIHRPLEGAGSRDDELARLDRRAA